MLLTLFGVLTRIVSNSYLNVFQKILTEKGSRSSVVNFYSYLGLSIIGLCFAPGFHGHITSDLAVNVCVMGLLGALGNFFIIKGLSCGELSTLSAVNSYKPVVAMTGAIIFLGEIPSILAIFAIGIIIFGTYLMSETKNAFNKYAVTYRVLALIFSGIEAVFIKRIILASDIQTAFLFWALAGFIFSYFVVVIARNKLNLPNIKYLILLIMSIAIMQYSTNYVFSKMDVAYALALFQLSVLLNVFLGANIFREKDFIKKLIASAVMTVGAVMLFLV